MLVAGRPIAEESNWDRIIEQIKGLSPDQRLKLSDNIRATAVEDIRNQQEDLQTKLANLSSLLGGQPAGGETLVNRPAGRPTGKTNTVDRVLAALRNGAPKTIKQLQTAAGTPWVNTAVSQLIQSRQIRSDGNRPAAYSLR